MCGICGIFSAKGTLPKKDVIVAMTRALRHRGDDAWGVESFDSCCLGHQRLAILDLKVSANQPFSTLDRRYSIVFNGEIYNFKTIRDQLESKYRFRTTSDTEVILYSWIEWGHRSIDLFNGMFAFTILDNLEKKLYCYRDRMGVKPFFYLKKNNSFIFASEIKALLKHPDFKREVDYTALSDYLSLGYITGEKTIFKDVKRLLPATYLVVNADLSIKKEVYWDVRDFLQKNIKSDKKFILNSLEQSVKRRLVSDVEVASFVSGGIDSSSILKYACKNSPKMRTFSIGFPEKNFSELAQAKRLSNHFSTAHQETIFSQPDELFLRKLMLSYDQPFADTSAVVMFQLSAYASKSVKVVLSGDGGDEMFGGYETYRADIFARMANSFPFWPEISKGFYALISNKPSNFKKVSLDYKVKQFLRFSGVSFDRAHYSWRLLFSEDEKQKLLSPAAKHRLTGYDSFSCFSKIYENVGDFAPYKQNMYVDLKTWLADDILVKIDMAGMAHSLEIRSPYLDKEIVEYSCGISEKDKVNCFNTKRILKQALRGEIPDYVLSQKKQGFNSPVSLWLSGPLRNLFLKIIDQPLFKEFFPNTNYIEEIYERHCRRQRDYGFCLWSLLMFGLWADNYL